MTCTRDRERDPREGRRRDVGDQVVEVELRKAPEQQDQEAEAEHEAQHDGVPIRGLGRLWGIDSGSISASASSRSSTSSGSIEVVPAMVSATRLTHRTAATLPAL